MKDTVSAINNQLFPVFFFSFILFSFHFPHVRALPDQIRQQQRPFFSIFSFDTFWMAFVAKDYRASDLSLSKRSSKKFF